MKQYRITSERVTLGKMGDIINEEALVDVNIDALIAGGHIEIVKAAATNNNNKNTEEK